MKTRGKYILDDRGNPVECDTLFEWGKWFEESFDKRKVQQDNIRGYFISTVFLGVDYNFGYENDIPILYETMIFKGEETLDFCERYATKEEALKRHKEIVDMIQSGNEKKLFQEEINQTTQENTSKEKEQS